MLAAAVAGCSGDDNVAPSTDASSDGTTFDATGDALPGEGGKDSSTGPEASQDSGSGGEVGPGEASTGDGEASCPITLPAQGGFVAAAATAACQRLQACCLVPAAQFNMATCITTFSDPSFGGWQGSAYGAPFLDGGRIGYDTTAACQCLQQTAALGCGLIPAATLTALENVCVSALQGQAAVNAPCSASLECRPGAYCGPGDGGMVCLPLVGQDGGCAGPGQAGQDQCSYGGLGTSGPAGNPTLYCNASNTCVPRQADNSNCMQGYECTGNNCLFPATGSPTCQSSGTFSDPGVAGGTCDYFTITDAGTD